MQIQHIRNGWNVIIILDETTHTQHQCVRETIERAAQVDFKPDARRTKSLSVFRKSILVLSDARLEPGFLWTRALLLLLLLFHKEKSLTWRVFSVHGLCVCVWCLKGEKWLSELGGVDANRHKHTCSGSDWRNEQKKHTADCSWKVSLVYELLLKKKKCYNLK